MFFPSLKSSSRVKRHRFAGQAANLDRAAALLSLLPGKSNHHCAKLPRGQAPRKGPGPPGVFCELQDPETPSSSKLCQSERNFGAYRLGDQIFGGAAGIRCSSGINTSSGLRQAVRAGKASLEAAVLK
uniref:Uncharacterized protein n=1 Tax=Anopheles melas TaxID=34690 RepID=A0A182ULD7_9DIPT